MVKRNSRLPTIKPGDLLVCQTVWYLKIEPCYMYATGETCGSTKRAMLVIDPSFDYYSAALQFEWPGWRAPGKDGEYISTDHGLLYVLNLNWPAVKVISR